MKKKPNLSPDAAADLRRRAEERLKAMGPADGTQRIQTEAQRTIHELHVHQIELEMQNEELRHARNEAETLLEKYTDLYDFAPTGYFSLDAKGRVLEVNLTGASLLGVNRSKLIRQRLTQFMTSDSRALFLSFLEGVFSHSGKQSCEVDLLQGSESPIAARIEAEMTVSKEECRAVMEDITRQRQAEKDRLILNKLESTGILAGGIAHDFNNMLTVISLSLEMVRQLTPSEENLDPHLENAEKTASAAQGLTQQLITFAEGGAPLLKPIRLPAIIRESARVALSGSCIRCTFSLPDDLWPIEADARQIEQVFRNLVLNAREAMHQSGTISIQAKNVLSESRGNPSGPADRSVQIRIADQGGGITKDKLPKIFDPYFSTKKRGTQKGMGLGLTICHAIVTKHKGTITAESAPGAGAVFILQFPAFQETPAKETPPLSAELAHTIKILVMDDEKGMRDVLRFLLESLGHEVETVAEGQKAVDVYGNAMRQGQPFHLVMLDLTIRDGMGGLETIRELVKTDPAVSAIVMSGYADDPAVLDPARYGFKDSLPKPFDSNKLKTILSRTIRSCFGSTAHHE